MVSSSNGLCVGASMCLQIRTLIKEDSVKNEDKTVIKKHVAKYNIVLKLFPAWYTQISLIKLYSSHDTEKIKIVW